MAFNRQFNPLPQSGPSYPSMAAPPGYPQRSSWYPNTTQNLPGTAWQPAPHHHYQQALPYTPDYPSRRGSYAMQSSSSGMASPSASMTPSMSWTTTSHYGRHGGSPSMSNDSFQNYANLSESSFQFFTPVRQGHFSMNATAPSFTPRFSGSISNDSVYGESNNPVLNPTHPGKQSSSANNASPLPRLHRTAPSISLSTSNRPSVTPIRSPLLSRGASPIGSSFSTGTTSTPLHNAFGLPLSKPRTYKVLLPLESDELTLADPRKRSLWSREPFDLDYEVPSSIEELTFPAGTRCKSPHPEDSCGPQELPDTLEIYLPNDWTTLRQALFEERMAKIGITSSYLESMNAQLADRASGTPSVNDAPRSHLRSESVYAAPFVPRSMANADAAHTRGHRQLGPRHQTAMSMNVPSFCEGFMRQQPPYGPRELRSSRADGAKLLRLESAGLVGAVEEEAENEMEGGNAGSSGHLQQPHSNIVDDISKPLFAESRMLQQSSANIVTEPEFGLTSSAASEEPERRASSPKASPAVHIHNRIAIEGAVGHSSMPNSASAHMEAEGGNDGLNTFHEPRKSISAPDLHERLLEAAQGAGLAESPADTEHSERESSDIASDVDTEYSNPSDEAQARARRDKGLSSASFSPAAGLHSLDSWLEPSTIFHPNQSIPTHFSGEHDTSKSSRQTNSNKATPTLNAAAPPFVLNAQLTMRDATSSSMTSNTVTNGLPNPFVPKPPKPLPTKSSFGASESRFSFAQKPILNVAAVENEPRHATNTTSNSTPWGIDSSSQPGEQDPEVSEDAGTKTLMEAKLATCSLLPDKVPAQTELHSTSPVLDTLDSDSSETIHSMAHDKVRRFKFPAPLSSKPVNRNGASSSKAPTLAAFGTIGRNTFQDGLESFICETDCSNDPVISAAHQAPIRHRASIPAFVDSVVREHSIHVIPQEGADRMHRSSNESSRASLSVPLVKCGDSKPGRHSEEEQQPPPTPVSIEVTVCASRPTPPSRLCQDVVRHKLQHAPPALLEDALDEARRETQLLKAVQETQNILSRIAHMQAISYDVENSSPSVQSPSNLTPSQLSGNRDATTSPSLASAEAVVNPGPEPTEAGFVISDQYLHTVSQAVKTGLMDAVPELLQALLPSCIPIPADHPATALESIAKPCLSDPENEKIVQRSGASVDDVSMLDNSHSFLTKDLVSELTLGCKALRDKREKLEQLQYLRQGQYVEDLENSQAAVGESRDDRGIFEEELLTAIREMGAERSLAENLRKELEESNLHVCELERQLGAESLIHKERQTAYKTELATLARKEEEHTSQFKILQGILSKEAASRVHLEDSLSRLNMDNTALREQFSAAQSKLSGFQTREAELKARLEAAQDTISQMREASERERRSQDLQRERAAQSHEWTRAYARMTIEAQHSLLACILAPSRSLNVPDLVGDWTFETCLGPDHPITNEATMEYLTVMQDEWVVDVQGMRA